MTNARNLRQLWDDVQANAVKLIVFGLQTAFVRALRRNQMKVKNSVTIRGPLNEIYAFASDVERWPEILPHYRAVRILEPGERERLVSMHCVRAFGPIRWPCKWRAKQGLDPEHGRVTYQHVSGAARGMSVEWSLVTLDDGVQTSISHEMATGRMPWSRLYADFILGRLFVQSIASRTLSTIKTLVEGGPL